MNFPENVDVSTCPICKKSHIGIPVPRDSIRIYRNRIIYWLVLRCPDTDPPYNEFKVSFRKKNKEVKK
jgi:uncharacterized protein YbbK (DUF523 family)